MRIFYSFLALAFLLTSCDDGDIITAELDFEDTFDITSCDGKIICHKIKAEPSESLSVLLDTTLDELIATEEDTNNPLLVVLQDAETTPTINSFNYRTYSNTVNDDVFCSAIPPSSLGVTNDYSTAEGTATLTIVLTEDDNDGIPAAFEDANIDGDDDPATNPTDTDGDGLPDYLDVDDDGDNVLTVNEMPNFSEEFELTQALNTDGDEFPNYLDTDDDQDGVLTINEDENGNNDPTDNTSNPNIGPDYLNDEVNTINVPATAYKEHAIQQSFVLQLTVSNITLEILTQDNIDFGTYTSTSSREVTPLLIENSYTAEKIQVSGPNPVTAAGDVLNYKITLVNTGITTLTGVTPTDTLPDGTEGTLSFVVETLTNDGVFEAGETWTYLISYTVTATDIANGTDVINNLSVITNELPDPVEDTAITPIQ